MTLDATQPQKTRPGKLGLILMITGFVILVLAAAAMFFQSRGTLPAGNAGRHLMIVGLGVYIMGRLLFWQGRRGRTRR
jgi:flagellar basal body-associated protein FliL